MAAIVFIEVQREPPLSRVHQPRDRHEAKKGKGDLLVQAYTDERAHTAQSAPELAASLDALMQWIEKGTKPSPQSIASSCGQMRATYDGPCRYHPDYEVKPLSTRYARSAPSR